MQIFSAFDDHEINIRLSRTPESQLLQRSIGVLNMRKIATLAAALTIAATAFGITMLMTPPASIAQPISSIDTYALTLKANPAMGENYDHH